MLNIVQNSVVDTKKFIDYYLFYVFLYYLITNILNGWEILIIKYIIKLVQTHKSDFIIIVLWSFLSFCNNFFKSLIIIFSI